MDIIGSASDTDGSIVTYEWREDNTRTLIVTNNQEPNIKDYTLYEDASDGNTQGWRVYDNTSPGATISNIYSSTKKNNVIQLKGDASKNAYILGGFGGAQAWNNTTQKNLKWSISSNEFFTIYIRINTTKGYKYLCYTPVDTDLGSISQNRYIHHALGANIINGLWSTYTRDLEADLQEFDSDNKLISILGFLVRGSVLVDDIQLFNPQQNNVYEPVVEEPVVEEPVVESSDTLNNKLTQIQKLLLSDSANNLNHNVDYIIAGDSTRALVGNEMINYYDEQLDQQLTEEKKKQTQHNSKNYIL